MVWCDFCWDTWEQHWQHCLLIWSLCQSQQYPFYNWYPLHIRCCVGKSTSKLFDNNNIVYYFDLNISNLVSEFITIFYFVHSLFRTKSTNAPGWLEVASVSPFHYFISQDSQVVKSPCYVTVLRDRREFFLRHWQLTVQRGFEKLGLGVRDFKCSWLVRGRRWPPNEFVVKCLVMLDVFSCSSYLGILVTSWAVSTVQFITLLAHKKIYVHVNQNKLEMISISMGISFVCLLWLNRYLYSLYLSRVSSYVSSYVKKLLLFFH